MILLIISHLALSTAREIIIDAISQPFTVARDDGHDRANVRRQFFNLWMFPAGIFLIFSLRFFHRLVNDWGKLLDENGVKFHWIKIDDVIRLPWWLKGNFRCVQWRSKTSARIFHFHSSCKIIYGPWEIWCDIEEKHFLPSLLFLLSLHEIYLAFRIPLHSIINLKIKMKMIWKCGIYRWWFR